MAPRTYTEQEVAALLERAAELQVQTRRQGSHGPGLTLAELETVAAESGLDPALLRQAAAELDAPARSLFDSSTGTSATHVFVERWAPGTLTADVWEDLVAELRHRYDTDLGQMMGMPTYGRGSTEQIGRTVEWRHTSLSGIETRVMARHQGEGIRLRLSQRVGWGSALAESITYGTALAGIAAFIVGAIAKSGWIGLGVLLVALLAVIPLILYADRTWRKKKHRELHALADRLATLISTPAAAPPLDVASTSEATPVLDTSLLGDTAQEGTARVHANGPKNRERAS